MRIYIAGPIRAKTLALEKANIERARDACADLILIGHAPFCPHTHTENFGRLYPAITYEDYMRMDLQWLDLCDAVLMLPGWKQSQGAKLEYLYAAKLGLPIYTDVIDIPLPRPD
jgi:nucleoside 2-deoxyribosyltransferase